MSTTKKGARAEGAPDRTRHADRAASEGRGRVPDHARSLISVAPRAVRLFERSKPEQKRELIAFVFSNLQTQGEKASVFIEIALRPDGRSAVL